MEDEVEHRHTITPSALKVAASTDARLIEKLTVLNKIAATLNEAVDVHGVLEQALADIVALLSLETAWITLRPPADGEGRTGSSWTLAAHHNLPPALDVATGTAWKGICSCQEMCITGRLTQAYNEVQCSRLAHSRGDRRGLAVHATTPLRSGDQSLGILNVAASDWEAFSPESLSLLTNVGSQVGAALERARLYDQVRDRRLREQKMLLGFSDRLLRHNRLDELMDYLVQGAREMLAADACALLIPDNGSGSLTLGATSGWRTAPTELGRLVPDGVPGGPRQILETQQPLVIEDLLTSDRVPWTREWLGSEGFRAHAAVPLITDERATGVLVINHRQPNRLQADELRGLQLIANQAAIALEKARLHREELKAKALDKELEIGRQIQLSLLPVAPPVVPGWELAAHYRAARDVGGDFYDCITLPGEDLELGLTIADVSGKGIPAALFMSRAHTMIRSAALSGLGPAKVMEQANMLICADRRTEMLVTAFYGVLETRSGRFTYANAGHARPLWLPAGEAACRDLPSHGLLLGAIPGIQIDQYHVDLAPGDLLVCYTDGVTEAMAADKSFFGDKRLMDVVMAHASASAEEMCEAIVDAVEAFAGDAPLSDDLTLLIVRRLPGG